jgi:hypothetical protein
MQGIRGRQKQKMVRRKLNEKGCSMQIRERQERRKRYKRQGKKRTSFEGREWQGSEKWKK